LRNNQFCFTQFAKNLKLRETRDYYILLLLYYYYIIIILLYYYIIIIIIIIALTRLNNHLHH